MRIKFCSIAILATIASCSTEETSTLEKDRDLLASAIETVSKYERNLDGENRQRQCKRATNDLNEMSDEPKQIPTWVLYAGKSHDCAGEYLTALSYYLEYLALEPDGIAVPEVREAIGRHSSLLEQAAKLGLSDLAISQLRHDTLNSPQN